MNTFNFDSLQALSVVFGATATPVIAQFSARFFRTHDPAVAVAWKTALGNPRLWLHLDHCADLALFKHCVAAGFDSVMFDGSSLPLPENIARSRRAVRLAKQIRKDVLVECEIGHVAGVEDGVGSDKHRGGIPKLDDVLDYHRRVAPDLLAVGFGNMHGHYRGNEFFDLELMREVGRALPGVPLVLHGGSGMRLPVVRQLVRGGHCKLNISTDLKVAWMDALRRSALAGSPLEACQMQNHDLLAFFRALRRKYASILPT